MGSLMLQTYLSQIKDQNLKITNLEAQLNDALQRIERIKTWIKQYHGITIPCEVLDDVNLDLGIDSSFLANYDTSDAGVQDSLSNFDGLPDCNYDSYDGADYWIETDEPVDDSEKKVDLTRICKPCYILLPRIDDYQTTTSRIIRNYTTTAGQPASGLKPKIYPTESEKIKAKDICYNYFLTCDINAILPCPISSCSRTFSIKRNLRNRAREVYKHHLISHHGFTKKELNGLGTLSKTTPPTTVRVRHFSNVKNEQSDVQSSSISTGLKAKIVKIYPTESEKIKAQDICYNYFLTCDINAILPCPIASCSRTFSIKRNLRNRAREVYKHHLISHHGFTKNELNGLGTLAKTTPTKTTIRHFSNVKNEKSGGQRSATATGLKARVSKIYPTESEKIKAQDICYDYFLTCDINAILPCPISSCSRTFSIKRNLRNRAREIYKHHLLSHHGFTKNELNGLGTLSSTVGNFSYAKNRQLNDDYVKRTATGLKSKIVITYPTESEKVKAQDICYDYFLTCDLKKILPCPIASCSRTFCIKGNLRNRAREVYKHHLLSHHGFTKNELNGLGTLAKKSGPKCSSEIDDDKQINMMDIISNDTETPTTPTEQFPNANNENLIDDNVQRAGGGSDLKTKIIKIYPTESEKVKAQDLCYNYFLTCDINAILPCPIASCSRTFSIKSNLRNRAREVYKHHLISHHGFTKNELNGLGFGFGRLSLSRIRKSFPPIYSERKTESKLCVKCGKIFSHAYKLKRHIEFVHEGLRHPKKKKHPCHLCQNTFSTKYSLKTHISDVHLKLKTFLCTLCPMTFTKVGLHYHMRTHTGEKPHKCEICGQAFAYTTQLKCHKYTYHSTQEEKDQLKIFVCDQCPMRFRLSFRLKQHIQSVHEHLRPYSCTKCDMKFKCSNNLRRHIPLHSDPTRRMRGYRKIKQ